MKKTYHIPAILFFLLSTTTLLFAQKSVYTFPFENTYKLPPMSVYINTDEIASTYQTWGNLYTTEITGLGDETMEQTSTTMISDVKAMDAIRYLEFYLKEQLVTPGDETSGAVEMSIIYYNSRSRANLGTALTVLTLGLGALFGIPFSTGITDVEVQATFFDDSNQLVTSHRGMGRAKVLETLYNINSTKRKQHQKAMKKALSDVNEKIMADPKLVQELKTTPL
ncbi:MAG: hypothetical protein IMY68_05000 [Bacteroidetes bacterium]|nr:hypothetical protein [Bacteroidota bacterium]